MSVDAVIWRGAGRVGRGGVGGAVMDTSLYFSPTAWQIWNRTVDPAPLLIPVFRQVEANGFLPGMRAAIQLPTPSGFSCGVESNASGFNVRHSSECDTILADFLEVLVAACGREDGAKGVSLILTQADV